jgi:hypothetical protein
LVLAISLSLPVVVVAAPSQEVVDKHREANRVMGEARVLQALAGSDPKIVARLLRGAGEAFAQAANLQPESPDTRGSRRDLLDLAVSAFIEAYEIWSADSAPLERAKTRVDRYVEELVAQYGRPGVESLAEFSAAQDHARALDAAIAAHRAARQASAPVVEPASAPVVEPARAPVVEQPRPPVVLGPPPTTDAAPRRTGPFRVALGISAGLLGASAAGAIGAAVQVSRTPFKGRLYQEIERATAANGLPHSRSDDMCVGPGREVAEVVDACDRRDRVAGVAVAMTVLSGAFAVSTVVFAVLLARARGSQAGRLREHAAGVVVAPQRGGAVLTLGARF